MFFIFAGIVAVVLLIILPVLATVYTEWLWFDSIGQSAVFLTNVSSQFMVFALAAGCFLALAMINLLIARVIARRIGGLPMAREGVLTYIARIEANASDRIVTFGALGIALILALLMGVIASSRWLMTLRFLHQTAFQVTDPLFELDVRFFVFELPLLRFLQGWLLGSVILTAGLCAAYYALRCYGFRVRPSDLIQLFGLRSVRCHFFTLAALAVLLIGAGYRLDVYELVYAYRGVVHGAGFADRYATLPALHLLTVTAVLVAVVLLISGLRRGRAVASVAIIGWLILAVAARDVFPALVQQFQVLPNELAQEKPFLEANLEMTRRAFALDQIVVDRLPGDPEPRPGVVERNPQTFSSIRLWDQRPLLATFGQVQTIRPYYDFLNVDVDRYQIHGVLRQVMLSARELTPGKLAGQAQTWVTQRLQFTHGYGLVMSTVNEVADDGLPQLVIKDIPPLGDIPVTRPEIYYGESRAGYVVVNTSAEEFDYPQGSKNVSHTYSGRSGVVLDSPLKKLAFAVAYQDANLILSNYLQPNSRILYHRQVSDRLARLAPFLMLDPDPYLVVADGQLYWIQDAYTTTDAYPYATPYEDGPNYVRNSVKVVTNAYDGSIQLYVADSDDPLIETYQKIYPTLFQPISAMPVSLRAHLRYPERIFLIQAEMLRAYHMRDPQVFYNREDLWDLPSETTLDRREPMLPYYVMMRPPGTDHDQFLLMLPFTPSGRDNMVAWLAASSTSAGVGKLLAFEYPKDRTVFGPRQIAAQIDQDAQVSQQLTLWNQQGSRVIRGNLLVLPIENSTLYVLPIYLQASQSPIPELKRVILATQSRLVMGNTLAESLQMLFTPDQSAETASSSTGSDQVTPGAASQKDVASLARSAQDHYQRAQSALKEGDWSAYGKEMDAMKADLDQLVATVGS